MIEGVLLGESIRPGSELSGVPLVVKEIRRVRIDHPGPLQPSIWTLLLFEADDSAAQPLADALAGCLLGEGGWYCDFQTAAEKFVVFGGRVFRYRRDDEAGHAAATGYGRSVGVPGPQLDWTR